MIQRLPGDVDINFRQIQAIEKSTLLSGAQADLISECLTGFLFLESRLTQFARLNLFNRTRKMIRQLRHALALIKTVCIFTLATGIQMELFAVVTPGFLF